jgi:7-cyano-7-deazaguanine synthase in queuosine biosynthesis
MTDRREIFRCDGAELPKRLFDREARQHEIVSRGPEPNLHLRLEDLDRRAGDPLRASLLDLLWLAAYVYLADQLIWRGSRKDVELAKWRRDLVLCVPVSDPDRWSHPQVQKALMDTLHFLTEDSWEFHFSQAAPPAARQPSYFTPEERREPLRNPDSVLLMSGGADSLCAVADAVSIRGRTPLLLSHSPAQNLDRRQKDLAELLGKRLHTQLPQLGVNLHRQRINPDERTQRARGFLFATLGAVIALHLDLRTVTFADNGIVSLNLPINRSILGAQASRSTHPRFLDDFNRLLTVLDLGPCTVENTLWDKTRADTLRILKAAGCQDLLDQTNSCIRSRTLPPGKTHCGYCSQCVDRRIGAIAADMEACDAASKYDVDIFRDELPEGGDGARGDARAMALDYLDRAKVARDCRDELDFLEAFPELYDAGPRTGQTAEAAESLMQLLHRHGEQTEQALKTVLERDSATAVRGELAPHSLLGLAVSRGTPRYQVTERGDEFVFRRDEDYWTVRYERQSISVKDSRGMGYLGLLLGQPNVERDPLALEEKLGVYRIPDDRNRDRARRAVDKAVRAAIEHIREYHQPLADHLTATVKLGVHPVYRPGMPVDWIKGPAA